MRLLNEDSDKKLDRITIYLTRQEAQELKDDLTRLIENPKGNHAHIDSEDYGKEITICIYEELDLEHLNERSIKLIKEDV